MITDMPSVYRMDIPTARQPHVCCECRGIIERGETYHVHSGIWDGKASHFKCCLECDVIRSQYWNWEDGCAFGHLEEELMECEDPELIDRFDANKKRREKK